MADPPRERDVARDISGLPLDPDVDAGQARPAGPFGGPGRRRPRIHAGVVAAIAAGGFFGGLARYAVGLAWPETAGGFPWPVLGINLSGAFLLALLLVVVIEVLAPTVYPRPALGTGFLGAFTTFSSVSVGTDQLLAHSHPGLAAGYLAASVFGSLAAGSFGLMVGRSVAAHRGRE